MPTHATIFRAAHLSIFVSWPSQCSAPTLMNLVFERDPTVVPDTEDCPNPPSQTLIKCSLFGGLLDASSATNSGQWQADFHVVIAGSNSYNAVAPPAIPGYGGVQNFGTAAVNAPANTTTYSKYQTIVIDLESNKNLLMNNQWEWKLSLRLSHTTRLFALLLAVQRVTLAAHSSYLTSCTRMERTVYCKILLSSSIPFSLVL